MYDDLGMRGHLPWPARAVMSIPPFGWFLICAAVSAGTLAANRRWKVPRYAAWIVGGAALLFVCGAAAALLHPLMVPIGTTGTEASIGAPEEQEVRERASRFWSQYVADNSSIFTISDDYAIAPAAWQDVRFTEGMGWVLYSYLSGERQWLQVTLRVEGNGRAGDAWTVKTGPNREAL
jgi:hypothetical protein